MKIISKFKDYYDYLSHIYGQDEKIIYNRNPLVDPVNIGCSLLYNNIQVITDIDHQSQHIFMVTYTSDKNYYIDGTRVRFPDTKWLCICGKIYLLISDNTGKFHVLNDNDPFYQYILQKKDNPWDRKTISIEHVLGYNCSAALDVCKQLHTPVFLFQAKWNSNTFNVESKIPVLSELNIPSIISPEQIYQEISYFICNTINPSPDMMGPIFSTDKEKILQHGFDLKQSFRHRK